MIRIELDIYAIAPVPEGLSPLILKQTADYGDVRNRIHEAVHGCHDLWVVVRDPVSARWFWDLNGYPNVTIVENDPRERLKEKLKKSTGLCTKLEQNPELIVSLALLSPSKPDPVEPVSNDWQWVVENCLGSAWTDNSPSWEHLTSLVGSYLQPQRSKEVLPQDLREEQRNKSGEWLEKATGKLKKAYEWFLSKPGDHARALLAAQVLDCYPENLRWDWLDEINTDVSSAIQFASDLKIIPLIETAVEEVSKCVEAYWNGKWRHESFTVDTLTSMSGKIPGELSAIYKWFSQHPQECSSETIDRLRLSFKELSGLVAEICEKLQTLVPPPLPGDPTSVEEWQDMLSWATQEYLRYRTWLDQRKRTEPQIEHFASVYADRLYANYPLLLTHKELFVYGVLHRIKEIVQVGYTVLWILVDNLSWRYVEDLVVAFRNCGMVLLGKVEPLLAMLPSETATSKLCMLAGTPLSQCNTNDLGEAFELAWCRLEIPGARQVIDEPDLDGLLAEPASLYLYQFVKLDRLAHQPEHIIIDREHENKATLDWLAERVGKAAKRIASNRPLRIVVSSDHGSVAIIQGKRKLTTPRDAQLDNVSEQHKRFVKVKTLEHLDNAEWYGLQADRFGLKDHYAIARGYFYLKSKPQGYTHGGLTPEETIVPYLEFEYGEPEPIIPLRVVYRGSQMRKGRKEKLCLVVRNPNARHTYNIFLSLPAYSIQLTLTDLGPNDEAELPEAVITLEPKLTVEAGFCKVEGICSYRIAGQLRHDTIEIKIPVALLYTEDKLEEFFM
jgi:hypothetical protein